LSGTSCDAAAAAEAGVFFFSCSLLNFGFPLGFFIGGGDSGDAEDMTIECWWGNC
jgi:hypothetical protein